MGEWLSGDRVIRCRVLGARYKVLGASLAAGAGQKLAASG